MDLAYFKNGYVYHTKYDDLNQVSLGSIQRAGNNLLGLVSTLAQMDWPASRDFDDTVIFFDYLGFFMIRFSNTSWHLLNILLVGMAFYQSISWVTAKDSGNSNLLYNPLFTLIIVSYCILITCFLQVICPQTELAVCVSK